MTELSLAARRVLFIALLFVLGVLAAALPALLGEPAGEHPALRGLAALVLGLLTGIFLVARWGGRGALPPKVHAQEVANLVASLVALLLPALFAGVTFTEVRALATLTQTALGWKVSVDSSALGFLLLLATYAVARLKSSVKGERLAGRNLVAVSVIVCLALVAASAGRLLQIPALAGLEILEKAVLLLLLLTVGVAAFLPGKGAGRDVDLRAIALAVGVVGVGLASSCGTYRYLRPTVGDIERILFTRGNSTGTTFAAAFEDRPDIYGLFSLQVASGTPQLAQIRPIGPSFGDLIEEVHRTLLGTARLVPRPESPAKWTELRPPEVEASFVEVWIRLRWWPWTDLRTGLRIREPVYDWAVSRSATLVVATTYVRSPEAFPSFRFDEIDQGTYALNLWRRGKKFSKLIDNLPLPPQILNLTERSVKLLISGESYSRGRMRMATSQAALRSSIDSHEKEARARGFVQATSRFPAPHYFGTTTCDLLALECEPWKSWTDSSSRSSKPDDRVLVQRYGSWSVLDTRTLATVLLSPRHPACAGDCDHAYLLRDGRVIRLLLLGSMPNWDARLSAFDAAGRETVVTAMGNVRLIRFAGDLGDGTVAIAWRALYAWSYTHPVFGWTLDAWNPATGVRRRLADDLATFPAADNDASMIFLDRRGRLVAPAVDGLRELAVLDSYRASQEQ